MDFRRMLGMMGANPAPDLDAPKPDTAEKVQISSLSLLKMLKHGICTEFFLNFWYFHSIYRSCWSPNGSYGINAWSIFR